jgi:hypothetical protein
MNAVVFDVALTAYIVAAAAALGSLFGRREDLARIARLLTAQAGRATPGRSSSAGWSFAGRRC